MTNGAHWRILPTMTANPYLRWLQPWRRTADPAWVGPVIAGLALLFALLAIFTDPGAYESAAVRRLIGLALASYALCMLLETGGWPWPRAFFLIFALLPVAAATYTGRDTIVPLLAMLVVWWVTYTGSQRQGLCALGAALLSILPPFLTGRGSLDNFFSWSISLLLIWVSVYVFALQRQTLAALRSAQTDLARQAAADERRRLAREVHDVVAHSLAITLMHVTGARHILARDPQRAASALAQAETLGRQSMADLRRTIGLLASEDGAGVAPPAPIAADIPGLIASFVQAGLAVNEKIEGDLAQVPPGPGLDLYRLTQEALTNTSKHSAGATVTLHLIVEEQAAQLQVVNPLPSGVKAATAGRGLTGMRERVATYSGRFSAGAENGLWRVAIWLPLSPQAAPIERLQPEEVVA